MSLRKDVASNPRGTLFDVLKDVKAGMLGLRGAGDGMQPMTHFIDAQSGVIWFVSSNETDLVRSLGLGEDAEYVVISQDHDVHASLRGKLCHLHNDTKLDDLWNPMVAAWFEKGREDPRIALLRFDTETADIWASTNSSLKLGFEVLRANLDPQHAPDIGTKATVRFPTAA